MYSAKFESDNGRVFYFGTKGQNAFSMDVGNGLSVNLGVSQGFLQVGEFVENGTVEGRDISVKGTIYQDIEAQKAKMRGVFAPFVAGTLTFNDEYTTRVYVKSTPSFSAAKGDGRFTMLLYAPYPFFYSRKTNVVEIGTLIPSFSFPINYATPHYFGIRGKERAKVVVNDGDVPVPFSLKIQTSQQSENIVITNMKTLSKIKLNGKIEEGDVLSIFRDEKSILRAELIRNGEKTDVISWIDEESDLFELEVGENPIVATDETQGENLIVVVSFRPAVVSAYEN